MVKRDDLIGKIRESDKIQDYTKTVVEPAKIPRDVFVSAVCCGGGEAITFGHTFLQVLKVWNA